MNWTAKDARRSRPYTTELLDMVEQGMIDKDSLISDLLGWMSEAEVEEFARSNDYVQSLDDEDDEDYEPDVDEATEWHDFDPDC